MADKESGGGRFLFGLVAGLGLSYVYITTGYKPPIPQPADELQSSMKLILADVLFEDSGADIRQRQRALALMIGEDPGLYRELDDRIGQAMTRSLVDKKLERFTLRLRGQRRAFVQRFSGDDYPELKQLLQKRYGTKDPVEMAAHLLAGQIAKDEFIAQSLRERHPGKNLLQIARAIME